MSSLTLSSNLSPTQPLSGNDIQFSMNTTKRGTQGDFAAFIASNREQYVERYGNNEYAKSAMHANYFLQNASLLTNNEILQLRTQLDHLNRLHGQKAPDNSDQAMEVFSRIAAVLNGKLQVR